MKIKFVTTNASKLKIARERLTRYGIQVEQLPLNLYEIQSLSVEEVSIFKAQQARKLITKPFIIEDSALIINALNGFPGALLKPVADSLGDGLILRLIDGEKDRSAVVISQMIFIDEEGKQKMFQGKYAGFLSDKPKGKNRRGWKLERIFIPKGFKKTLAEFDDKEWHFFLDNIRKNDHYEKFGKWISEKYRNQ